MSIYSFSLVDAGAMFSGGTWLDIFARGHWRKKPYIYGDKGRQGILEVTDGYGGRVFR